MPTVPGMALPTAVAAAPASEDSPAYSGQIVDYNEDKGFGFIECKDTQQIYGSSAACSSVVGEGKGSFILRLLVCFFKEKTSFFCEAP